MPPTRSLLPIFLIAACWAQQPPALHEDRLVMLTAEFDEGPAQNGAGVIFGSAAGRIYIATANHVIRSGPNTAKSVKAFVKGRPGESFAVKILEHSDPILDLAVAAITDPDALGQKPAARILGDSATLKRGDKVWSTGYPQSRRWYSRPAPDHIQRSAVDSIRFDSPFISAGYSGGGLFDERGHLVGIIKQDAPPEGVAIPIERVLERLREWGYPIEIERAAVEQSAAQPRTLVVRLLRVIVKEDGSSGATNWDFRATVNGNVLLDWREKSFDDDAGRNVYVPNQAETKLIEAPAGQPVRLVITGDHSHGERLPISKDTTLAPGAEVEVPVSTARSRKGDFIFVFSVVPK